MISPQLLALARCPDCRGRVRGEPPALTCDTCGRRYDTGTDYLDLRPADVFAEQTKYLDASLHADARHETVSPPLLSAAVRNDMLRAFLQPRAGDRIVDLGCGSGRVLLWNRGSGAYQAGIDVTPFFAVEARADVDLALGDLRRLPFADGAFTKAYALDVLEHLSRDALTSVLAEAARVLEPGGRLFVYSHVRKNSRLALGLRAINRVAAALDRVGLVDLSQERLRKSDHLNPLADIPDLERVVADAGFRLARIRYYTPLAGAFIENILARVVQQALARRASRAGGAGEDSAGARAAARTEAKRRIARRGATYWALCAATAVMKADIVLFGRVRSGPFFALLVKESAPGTGRQEPTEPRAQTR